MVFLLLVTLSWYHGGGGVVGDENHVVAVVDHLNKNYKNDDVVVDLITEVAKRVDGAMQRRCLNSQLPWFLWHLTKLRFYMFSFFGCLPLSLWHFVQMLVSIWPSTGILGSTGLTMIIQSLKLGFRRIPPLRSIERYFLWFICSLFRKPFNIMRSCWFFCLLLGSHMFLGFSLVLTCFGFFSWSTHVF